MRNILIHNTEIHLQQTTGEANRTFCIDALIGQGATCCVYDAHCKDNGKKVRLKELYPIHSHITRDANALVWANPNQKQTSIQQFQSAGQLQLDLLNNATLGNSTVHIDDLYAGNGTCYLVTAVDYGKTFAQYIAEEQTSLCDVAKTVLALTKSIGKIHKAGYLHLDIKPENFLVLDETFELVKLFDVDAMVRVEDINSGDAFANAYSLKWAAPEQKLNRIAKFCEATDIYAIGAILFNAIMGRDVENEDIGLFAQWDFDNKHFQKTNPVLKSMFEEIFHKTLAASCKRRYQSTEELQVKLEEIVHILEMGAPFVLSNNPPVGHFVGRAQELDTMREFLSGDKASTLFLRGFGGMGKTTLALQYAHIHSNDYHSVIFMDYRQNPSLQACLSDLKIYNFDEDNRSTKEHLEAMRQMCADSNLLIILDNFDVNADDDPLRDDMLSLPAHIVVTTRNDFSYKTGQSIQQMTVDALDEDGLVALFETYSNLTLHEETYTQVLTLLHSVGNATLLVPILARQLSVSGVSIEELSNSIFSLQEKVRNTAGKNLTIYDHVKAVFDLANMTEDEQQVLRNLWALEVKRLAKNTYRTWTKSTSLNTLNQLIESGWVGYTPGDERRESLFLHPLVSELIRNELAPTQEKCLGVFEYLKKAISTLQYDTVQGGWNYDARIILHALSKWLDNERKDSVQQTLLHQICVVLEKVSFPNGSEFGDAEASTYLLFDEGFSPKDIFRPALATSQKLVADAKYNLTVDMDSYTANIFAMSQQYPNGPKTQDELFWATWEFRKNRLTNYIEVLRTHIILQFLYVLFLSHYDTVMTVWGEWYNWEDWDNIGAMETTKIACELNCAELNHYTLQSAKCIESYNETIVKYAQIFTTLTESERVSVIRKYHFDTHTVFRAEVFLKWYWSIIQMWNHIEDSHVLETVVTTETGRLHQSMYEVMRHGLVLIKQISETVDKADQWGNYDELEQSLISLMSKSIYRMKASATGETSDAIAITLALGGWPLQRRDELLSRQFPPFPSTPA